RQDFAALADCLDPAVRLRALVPRGPIDMTGRDDVAGWFRSLFGGPDDLELADGTVGEIGPRLYMRWRVSLTPTGTFGRRRLAEQHVFAMTGTGGPPPPWALSARGLAPQPGPGNSPTTGPSGRPSPAGANPGTGPSVSARAS